LFSSSFFATETTFEKEELPISSLPRAAALFFNLVRYSGHSPKAGLRAFAKIYNA
jgi:hypothetical protein